MVHNKRRASPSQPGPASQKRRVVATNSLPVDPLLQGVESSSPMFAFINQANSVGSSAANPAGPFDLPAGPSHANSGGLFNVNPAGLATINAVSAPYSFVGGPPSSAPQPVLVPRSSAPPVRINGHTLGELNLAFPAWLSPDELVKRHRAIAAELGYQKDHPAIEPPSRVPDLPPKEDIPEYISFPDKVDDETRRKIEDENNRIATIAQRIDRQRNNMAAKKSRAIRLESRDNYRELYMQTTARLYFHRLTDAAEGRDPNVWERLPEHIRNDLVSVVRRASQAIDEGRAEAKKQDEARKRAERSRIKNERRALREAAGLDGLEAIQNLEAPGSDMESVEPLAVVSPEPERTRHFQNAKGGMNLS